MTQPQLSFYPLGEDAVAFSTTRHGGYSTGTYSEFNITHYCGDNDDAVHRNRMALCRLLDIGNERLILPRQNHGTKILRIDDAFLTLSKVEKEEALEGVDGLVTNVPDVCIGVSTADCIPVLLYDSKTGTVAAVHAGWRGTVGRIVEKAVATMVQDFGSHLGDMVAQIGPGIGLDSFEVGDDVYEAFAKEGFPMDIISKKYPALQPSPMAQKWHIDLPQCNRLQLISCGIPEQGISLSPVCTYRQSETYFSARRLGIQSGRIFTGIMLKGTGRKE